MKQQTNLSTSLSCTFLFYFLRVNKLQLSLFFVMWGVVFSSSFSFANLLKNADRSIGFSIDHLEYLTKDVQFTSKDVQDKIQLHCSITPYHDYFDNQVQLQKIREIKNNRAVPEIEMITEPHRPEVILEDQRMDPLSHLYFYNEDANQAQLQTRSSIWSVHVSGHVATKGTGFFITPYLFVTSLHVIAEWMKKNRVHNVLISQGNQIRKIKKVKQISLIDDLILLEVNQPVEDYIEIANQEFNQNEVLYVTGGTQKIGGYFFERKTTSVMNRFHHFYRFSVSLPMHLNIYNQADTLEGYSGAPIFNQAGKVVSVLSHSFQNRIFAIDGSSLKMFLEYKRGVACHTDDIEDCFDTNFLNVKTHAKDFSSRYELVSIFRLNPSLKVRYCNDMHKIFNQMSGNVQLPVQSWQLSICEDFQQLYSIYEKESLDDLFFPQKEQLSVKVMIDNELLVIQSALAHLCVDSQSVFYWTMKAAEQGLVTAQYNLGIYYKNGKYIEQNHELSAYWLKKAAYRGHWDAQYELGKNYFYGNGVSIDYERAFYWLQKLNSKNDWIPTGSILSGL